MTDSTNETDTPDFDPETVVPPDENDGDATDESDGLWTVEDAGPTVESLDERVKALESFVAGINALPDAPVRLPDEEASFASGTGHND